MFKLTFISVAILSFFVTGGFSAFKSKPVDSKTVGVPSGLTFRAKSTVEGYSVKKRPIVSYQFGSGKETVLYFGVFHGDEQQGKDMLLRFMEELDRNPELIANKKVVVVPLVNPDGYAKNVRTSARGVDLNRNYQTRDWTRRYTQKKFYPGTRKPEPETRAVLNILKKYKPDAIVTLHAYLHCNNYDGPAQNLAFEMAKRNHYKVRSYIGYKTPGSFGTYTGKERNIPVITLELSKTTTDNSWDRHRDALLSALKLSPDRMGQIPQGENVFSSAANGDLETLAALMKKDHSVYDRDETGWSPLLYAAYFGQKDTVKWLIDNGADVNQADDNGGTPLLFAAQNDHDKIVELLLKNGAHVNAQDRFGNTPLMEAGRNANMDPLKVLLAHGADVHMKDREGKSVLIDAARGGYIQTLKTLLDNGADINDRDAFGRTALIEAAEHDYPSMVRYLIERGADITVRDQVGRTALTEARKNNSRKIVSMLRVADRARANNRFNLEPDQDKTGK